MVEPVMYFGIGFLVAALFGLLFVPLVHNRAVRLTMRRLEAATPLSITEIRADKDQLRAEFAMSTRRLELSVEQMKARATSQLAEIGKKANAINQLRKELGDKTATILELETREKNLREQLRGTEEEFAVKSGELREAEKTLAEKESELGKLIAELGERSMLADGQRVELMALRTQVDAMKVSVGDYESAVKAIEERLAHEREAAEGATKQLTEARGRLTELSVRADERERQLLVHTTEAELLNRRVHEMESRFDERGRTLAEREFELERLRGELEAAKKLEADLRGEIGSADARAGKAAEKFRADIDSLEAQLATVIEERSKLQRELATMKRDAETTWAAERVENALLRERINDVAAEVARLTAALEGPGSPIESMLAVQMPPPPERAPAATGKNGSAEAAPAGVETPQRGKGTLADRIRALQTSASRVMSELSD
jgi:chromosome segregation ATPase